VWMAAGGVVYTHCSTCAPMGLAGRSWNGKEVMSVCNCTARDVVCGARDGGTQASMHSTRFVSRNQFNRACGNNGEEQAKPGWALAWLGRLQWDKR
jgi:hypothetical protein